MGIFALSDIVITTTLLVNALALLSSKVSEKQPTKSSSASKIEQQSLKDSTDALENVVELMEPTPSAATRFYQSIYGVRQFSCIIVFWNMFFMILMVFVFRD